jgi:hypothetical protein
VHEPDDVVLRLAEDGVARVRQVDHDPGRLVRRHRGVEELDLGARHHHLAHLSLAGVEHVVDELALLRRQRLLRGQDPAQLVVADELLVGVRVAAEGAHEQVGRLREQPDERTRDAGEPVDRARDGEGDPLGALQADALGRQLSQHERDVDEQDRDEDEGDRIGRALRQAQVHEQR